MRGFTVFAFKKKVKIQRSTIKSLFGTAPQELSQTISAASKLGVELGEALLQNELELWPNS